MKGFIMCKTGGPRCAGHLGPELKQAVAHLSNIKDDPDATKVSIKRAEKEVSEKSAEYDSTPTGQKKIQKEIDGLTASMSGASGGNAEAKTKLKGLQKRLEASEKLRVENEQKGEKIRQDIKEFEELKAQADEELENPTFAVQYKNALTNAVMADGVIHERPEKNSWGGPTADYEAENHFKQCGVMITSRVEENYSWKEYDTFTTDDKIGLCAEVTCHCGQEKKRNAVLEGASMGSLLNSMLNNTSKR